MTSSEKSRSDDAKNDIYDMRILPKAIFIEHNRPSNLVMSFNKIVGQEKVTQE